MCKDATIKTRVYINDKEDEEIITTENKNELKQTLIDEESKMLCNVIVQATYELHVHQKKNRDDIQEYLKNDCQKLTTPELIQKVRKKYF